MTVEDPSTEILCLSRVLHALSCNWADVYPEERIRANQQKINNADFVFYISAMETERCQKGMTVAYAAHCQQEAALDRYSKITLVTTTL